MTPAEPPTTPTTPGGVKIWSFGYLHGSPPDADLTIDLRELIRDPNPIPGMREMTGLDARVIEHVLNGSRDLLERIVRFTVFLNDGMGPGLVTRVALGCSGGRHRSVVMADALRAALYSVGFTGESLAVVHMDVHRPVVQREAAS